MSELLTDSVKDSVLRSACAISNIHLPGIADGSIVDSDAVRLGGLRCRAQCGVRENRQLLFVMALAWENVPNLPCVVCR